MNIFDIMGPIMVGPSSSHTAGAARMGRVARHLLGSQPVKADIQLHGSFAATGSGHGTDRAIVAGLLDLAPDHPGIPHSFELARQAGMAVSIRPVDLPGAHPNTAVLHLTDAQGRTLTVSASSLGGGRIRVNAIAPGFFATKQNAALLFNPDGSPTPRTGKILAATPMGRFGDTEKELAGAVLFLLNNEAASFITGVCIPIDGGFSAYSGV